MSTGALHRLNDCDTGRPDSRWDIRGHKVVDEAGEEVGKVEDVLVGDRQQRVRFIQVEAGGLLGSGRERILLPMEAVREIRGEVVRLSHSRLRVSGAPEHDPDLVQHRHLSQIYWYYGYRSPLWSARDWYPE
jgi:sporulation protein YlmC with PRC-barrel domain